MVKSSEDVRMAKRMAKSHVSFIAESGEKILTKSKVKQYFKSMGLRLDGSTSKSLADKVYALMYEAAARCTGNDRKTVRPVDL